MGSVGRIHEATIILRKLDALHPIHLFHDHRRRRIFDIQLRVTCHDRNLFTLDTILRVDHDRQLLVYLWYHVER